MNQPVDQSHGVRKTLTLSFRKTTIILFCIIEIMLMSPRTFSYIVIDLLPIRIFGLPLITFSFFITIAGYISTELLADTSILTRLKKFRFAVVVWSGILVLSALVNPLRDVVFEGQGMIIFMMNVVMFSVASVYLKSKRRRLIWGIFFSIAGTIFILNYILLTNPLLLPKGYSQDDIRFEGLYSSTPIMALVAISTTFTILYRKLSFRLIGLAGILISISGLVMTATRSAFGASVITFLLVVLYYINMKSRSNRLLVYIFMLFVAILIGMIQLIGISIPPDFAMTATKSVLWASLFASVVVVFYCIKMNLKSIKLVVGIVALLGLISITTIQFTSLHTPFEDNIEYFIDRVSLLGETHYDQSRLDEAFQDVHLFSRSPLFGHGYGLLNIYSVEGWGTPFFGHNFATSILSRTGILGLTIIFWYGFTLFKKTGFQNATKFFDVFVISRAALASALSLILISNFTGFQTFGIYGALAGIACGVNISQDSKEDNIANSRKTNICR